MQTIARTPHARAHRAFHGRSAAGLREGHRARAAAPPTEPRLSVRVLDMDREGPLIMGLREHAPIDAEHDLDPGAQALERQKDRLGMVMAIWRDETLIATIRFIPCGHGVTLAEKAWAGETRSKAAFGASSWEVGRLIVAPEHRSMATLQACVALSVQELLKTNDVQYLHASCSPLLARLYRCFGFVTDKVFQSGSGMQHVLIHALVADMARVLGFAPAQRVRRRSEMVTA
ncbi:N-acyl amino acid synthase FeeM domain-containing protein [Hydrogenophaga sp. BPS33]|uniref:N-acyl amino acid synthase FeeM domain-containing protein n=1 Tax=Hydrogenophaga sp. BPS33 TaxID=2651974 RepID=UPI0013200039|nr:hypothetical protein [Hydrogenophaga sp. BPS33]QHE87583.1 hypothetical protein F9K07_23140 [Hydrogenophaga sp. BPS33]